MDLEVEALVSRETWTSVLHLEVSSIFTCKWVFTLEYHIDGTIACHKPHLVARGFTQVYIDHTEMFSLVICLHSICVLLSLAVNQALSLIRT